MLEQVRTQAQSSASESHNVPIQYSPIPAFYRIFFTIIDPIVASSGVLLNTLDPHRVLQSYSPYTQLPPRTETEFLLEVSSGFLLGIMLLQVFLLRAKPTDITVWKYVQGSDLIVDISMLSAVYRALASEGRLSLGNVRMDDWINIGVLVTVGSMRTAFLLGIGMGRKTGKTSKRK